jgi:hypothetical protein
VAWSDGDNCSDDKGCSCACCVASACEQCRQEFVAATSCAGSVSTDTLMFSHEIPNAIDYVWPPETPLVDAAAREPLHAQQPSDADDPFCWSSSFASTLRDPT